jgi:hypothetical protein
LFVSFAIYVSNSYQLCQCSGQFPPQDRPHIALAFWALQACRWLQISTSFATASAGFDSREAHLLANVFSNSVNRQVSIDAPSIARSIRSLVLSDTPNVGWSQWPVLLTRFLVTTIANGQDSSLSPPLRFKVGVGCRRWSLGCSKSIKETIRIKPSLTT